MDDDIKIEIRVLTERLNNFMDTTEKYRTERSERDKSIENQLKEISGSLGLLPCRERQAWYKSLSAQVKTLWTFVTAITLVIIGGWIQFWIAGGK